MWRKIKLVVGMLLLVSGVVGIGSSLYEMFVTDSFGNSERDRMIQQYKNDENYVVSKVDIEEPPVKHNPDEVFLDDRSYQYMEGIGLLHVPKWDNSVIPMREGDTREALHGAAGHYPETQKVGQLGNFAISAHRRSHGSNFRDIDKLVNGDVVGVETTDKFYVYRVVGTEIVKPEDVEVILPVPNKPDAQPVKRLMTLTTCHPEWGESERYVVYTELSFWTWKKDGAPTELIQSE